MADDEVALLAAVCRGERDAVRALLDGPGPVVYGFVFARVGGDQAAAEDLVQETFAEAVRSASTFRGESQLSTWMCTIARRRIARYFESERRQELARSGLAALPSDDAMEAPDADARDEVVRALGKLPALHRHVLVLKYLDGRSVAEIAGEIGKTRVQVQSLLQRARDGLRHQLEATA